LGVPTNVTLTLVTRPGCHLCDTARAVVGEVAASVPSVTVSEVSIDDDPGLAEAYAEEIPVVLIDGRVHNIWRVDPDRLRAALLEATK
jgi:glutaredoxin